jgi:hypothetical protein
MIRLLSLPTAVLVTLLALSLAPASPGPAHAGETGTTAFAIDLDATAGGVQSTASVPNGSSFHARVTLSSLGSAGYVGYQVKMFYQDDVLDAVGLPTSWNSAPTATEGGNVAAFPNGPDCGPAPGGNALQDNNVNGDTTEDDLGENSLLMFCNDNAVVAQPTVQDLVDFVFTCTGDGARTFVLAVQGVDPQGGTNITNQDFIPQGDAYATATVTCGSGGAQPTNTPTSTPTPLATLGPPTATNTPGPSPTPTSTIRPSATPQADDILTTPTPRVTPDFGAGTGGGGGTPGTGTTAPGGGPGGTITLPDTGMGSGTQVSQSTMFLLAVLLASVPPALVAGFRVLGASMIDDKGGRN